MTLRTILMAVRLREVLLQELPRVRLLVRRDLFRRAFRAQMPAPIAASDPRSISQSDTLMICG
jgi:hypothetical protein